LRSMISKKLELSKGNRFAWLMICILTWSFSQKTHHLQKFNYKTMEMMVFKWIFFVFKTVIEQWKDFGKQQTSRERLNQLSVWFSKSQ
jgi:hypothetical protein